MPFHFLIFSTSDMNCETRCTLHVSLTKEARLLPGPLLKNAFIQFCHHGVKGSSFGQLATCFYNLDIADFKVKK